VHREFSRRCADVHNIRRRTHDSEDSETHFFHQRPVVRSTSVLAAWIAAAVSLPCFLKAFQHAAFLYTHAYQDVNIVELPPGK
jgi:hypothetical protein